MYICIYNYEHAFIMAKYELYIPCLLIQNDEMLLYTVDAVLLHGLWLVFV